MATELHDTWVLRLKAAFDAGYYRTEACTSQQEAFPWQNRTCKDCPFWLNGVCQVHAEPRSGNAHTCTYFDAQNRTLGEQAIEGRRYTVRRMGWGRLER